MFLPHLVAAFAFFSSCCSLFFLSQLVAAYVLLMFLQPMGFCLILLQPMGFCLRLLQPMLLSHLVAAYAFVSSPIVINMTVNMMVFFLKKKRKKEKTLLYLDFASIFH